MSRIFSGSGELVSNTWVICPEVGDNFEKSELIPHVFRYLFSGIKAGIPSGTCRFRMSPRPIS